MKDIYGGIMASSPELMQAAQSGYAEGGEVDPGFWGGDTTGFGAGVTEWFIIEIPGQEPELLSKEELSKILPQLQSVPGISIRKAGSQEPADTGQFTVPDAVLSPSPGGIGDQWWGGIGGAASASPDGRSSGEKIAEFFGPVREGINRVAGAVAGGSYDLAAAPIAATGIAAAAVGMPGVGDKILDTAARIDERGRQYFSEGLIGDREATVLPDATDVSTVREPSRNEEQAEDLFQGAEGSLTSESQIDVDVEKASNEVLGLNGVPTTKTPQERIEAYKTMFSEIFGQSDEESRQEKMLGMAMIGFMIASGESPNALTNIAKGLAAGTQQLQQTAATTRKRKDKISELAITGYLDDKESASRSETDIEIAKIRAGSGGAGKDERRDFFSKQLDMWPKLLQEGLADFTITLPEGVDKSEWILERSREIAVERTNLVFGKEDDTAAHKLAIKEALAAGRTTYTLGGKTYEVQ